MHVLYARVASKIPNRSAVVYEAARSLCSVVRCCWKGPYQIKPRVWLDATVKVEYGSCDLGNLDPGSGAVHVWAPFKVIVCGDIG